MPKNNQSQLLTHPGRKQTSPMFDSRVSLPDENRLQLVALLNARLADTIDLQTQTKFAHWNVKGNNFYQLHLLFDAIAEHLEEAVDLIAERTTALGGRANGTARQAAEYSNIPEYDIEITNGMDHVQALVERLSTLANAVRKAIDESDKLGDKGTSDLFTEIVREADKDLYFLESHLLA